MATDTEQLRRLAAELLAIADHLDGIETRLTPGLRLVAAERLRQIDVEGYTAEQDARLRAGELRWAASCYIERAATPADKRAQDDPVIPPTWPWPRRLWKPKDSEVRNLVIASALVVAEVDRLIREGRRP